jgi:hypothetical protein
MSIKRKVVSLAGALVLCGVAGGLTGCSNPSNGGTGTPADTATDSSAIVPSNSSGAPSLPSSSGSSSSGSSSSSGG